MNQTSLGESGDPVASASFFKILVVAGKCCWRVAILVESNGRLVSPRQHTGKRRLWVVASASLVRYVVIGHHREMKSAVTCDEGEFLEFLPIHLILALSKPNKFQFSSGGRNSL
jgi:hypothetical protein